VVVDHGKGIGTGFNSSDTDVIKLKDVLAVVADNPNSDAPTPKSNGDIVSALTTLGVGGDIADFATYLGSAPNLVTVKKKSDKGAKIYKAVTDAGVLTKSYTNLRRAGDGSVFDDKDALIPIDTSAWENIQHFPASNSATDGVQD
jgi:hypothetical protein